MSSSIDKMEDLLETLKYCGLQENEAKVYLAGIRLGSSTANEIGYKAGILRTTCYEILKRLVEKGIVTEYNKDNIKYFDVVAPKVLLKNLENKTHKLKSILSNLEKMKETTLKRPKSEVFSGFKGIKSLLDVQLEENKDISVLGKITLSNNFLGPYRDDYIKERIKKKLKGQVICEPGEGAEEFRKSDVEQLRKTKVLKCCEDMKATLVLFGDKTAIITFLKEDPIGVLIHNKDITDTFKTIFNEFWKKAR